MIHAHLEKHMSKSRTSRTSQNTISSFGRRRLYLAIIAASHMAAGVVEAGPDGGTVVGGSGSIARDELNTTITQNSDRLSIDWNSFNVAANESVTFIQPSSSSIVHRPQPYPRQQRFGNSRSH
jgi:large exoprotein involved in heme utilization and adhesion